jgi:signal transduction histidine kinase
MLSGGPLAAARAASFAGTVRAGDEQRRVYARPVDGTGAVAIAGQSIEDSGISRTLGTAITALIVGGIVLVLAGGAGAYWLAAAALSPVERMRRQVAALSVGDTAGGVEVPRTRDELAALAGTMNALLARLHEALARQRGFVADASHELRTPLAVLGAELELAGRPGRSRDELASAVANAEDEVERLTRLTNDLLLLARSDEGRLPVRPVPTDVGLLLAGSAERFAGRARDAGVTCDVDVPASLVAELDEDRIRQAVDNLIDNALRFSPRGSVVRVVGRAVGERAAREGGDLLIQVADGGPGFPDGFLPHAFERFKRPDTSRARSDGGAGLGLAIVAAIAAAHGGVASARNGHGGGAVVGIELPGAVTAASGSASVGRASADPDGGSAGSGSAGLGASEPGPSASGPAR